jgi:hypothetical protein
MDMFLLIVVITVLAILYGLAWHDQPAKRRGHNQQAENE